MTKLAARAATLAGSPCSPAVRASDWNMYVVSLTPYPSQLCSPLADDCRVMVRCLSRVFPTGGWGHHWVVTGLGVHFGVAGAPRCPLSAGRAAGAIAAARGNAWGPPPLTDAGAHDWRSCLRAFDCGCPDPVLPWGPPSPAADRRRLHDLARAQPVTAQDLRHKGGSIYRGMWAATFGGRLTAWLRERSGRRRWLPTDGTEWHTLVRRPDFASAFHILRLPAGGLRGAARGRSAAVRCAHPWWCTACGSPSARWAWLTPAPGHDGCAWCAACLGDDVLRDGGAHLTAHLVGTPPPWPGTQAACGSLALPAGPGAFPACPLCGLGEAGGEHLLIWCPAVAAAWAAIRPVPLTLLRALTTRGDHASVLGTLLHQTSFLHASLLHRVILQAPQAGARLVRAIRNIGRRDILRTRGRASGTRAAGRPR